MTGIKVLHNSRLRTAHAGADLSALSQGEAQRALRFHRTFPEYAPTPLHTLPGLAHDLGVGQLFVKDESHRFGLNAFKVLGGAYAIGRYLAKALGRDIDDISRDMLCSDAVRRQLGELTFATTTDGNHGRGVAWTAQQLGQKAVVYMPKGSARERVDNILAHGAACTVTDLNYDEAVAMTWDKARANGWVMVQDTAWDGYEDIPTWIMQGYMTLALEALEQMRALGTERPTHVLLQAGVGSFAGAVLGYLAAELGPDMPRFIIVEPHNANCIYTSARIGDGAPHTVTGDLDTLMAGLACGAPNTVSWGLLRDYAHSYMSCPDYVAANGMRMLGAPLHGDSRVISGESGAVTTGALQWIMQHPGGADTRKALQLDGASRVLCVSTEGDTSPATYRNVVWFGQNPDGDRSC